MIKKSLNKFNRNKLEKSVKNDLYTCEKGDYLK